MANIEVQIKTDQKVVKPYLLQLAECSICSEICSNQDKLVHHMSLVHQIKPADRPLQCPTCHLSFKNYSTLWRHKQTHIQLPHSFPCQQCPKAFQNKASLNLHMRTHKDEKPYACQLCSYKSNQLSNLKTHMLKHEVAQFKCKECDKVFKHKGTLLKHINSIHLGKKEKFPCPFCNKNYSCPQALKPHIKMHTGEDMEEECPVCHKMYRRLQGHMIMHKEKLLECNTCHTKFRRTQDLQVHMRTHTGEKPYKCKFCSKTFRQQQQYMSHLKTHTSEKGHQCTICKKSFSTLHYLKLHVKKHDGTLELKYACAVCPKKFLTSYHLRIHAAIHVPPQQRERFECKECGMKLASKPQLAEHKKKHSGIRFQCAFCDYEIYRVDLYKTHVRTHTGTDIVGYSCKDCGKEFESARAYRKHVVCCNVKQDGDLIEA